MDACEDLGYPVILKRNTGGRSVGIIKIDNPEQAENAIKDALGHGDGYGGSFIVQEFIRTTRDHDARVLVIGGAPRFSYGRTLLSKNGEDVWLASYSEGSKLIQYDASEDEMEIATAASAALGTDLNEVDIYSSPEGPVIIENNLVATYIDGEQDIVNNIAEFISKQTI